METDQEREERYKNISKTFFAQFKQSGKMVPGANGVVELNIEGDDYRLKLWNVRRSMQEWGKLSKKYGEAVALGIMGFVRYYTTRDVGNGEKIPFAVDLERGEELLAAAVKYILEALPGDDGFFHFVQEYFPNVLTRKVMIKNIPIWVDVFDPSQPKEDVRETDGIGVGFDNFYIRKQGTIYKLLFWIFAENMGGFFLEKFQNLFQPAPLVEKKSSSPE